jgi:hypothetical protein
MKKLPPHPATVVQRRGLPASLPRRPPHPATVRVAQPRFDGVAVGAGERSSFDPKSARSAAHPAARASLAPRAKTAQAMFFPFAESRMEQAKRDKERRRRERERVLDRLRFPTKPCPVVVGGHVGVSVRFMMLCGSPPSEFTDTIDSCVKPDERDDVSESSEQTALPERFAEEVKALRLKFVGQDEDDLDFCSSILNDEEREKALSKDLREYLLSLDDNEDSVSVVEDPPLSEERHEELVIAVQKRLGVLILEADPRTALCCWTLSPPSKENHPGANLLSFSSPTLGVNGPLAYYLPYAADRMTCLALGDQADWFFTDLMEGCSLRIVGTPTSPLVCHANVRSIDDVDCKRDVVQVLLESATAVVEGFSTVSATLLREQYFEAGYTAFVCGQRDRDTGEWSFWYWRQDLSTKGLSGSKVKSAKELL